MKKTAVKYVGLLVLFCNSLFFIGCHRDKPRNFDMPVVGNTGLFEKGQVISSHDGFYNADSVFYELRGSDSFQYCVNCYSADSLKKFTGGFWLRSREHEPNTWENSRFSMPSEMFTDTGHCRPDVVKGNTIWVRIFNGTGYIDQHHFVFLGKWRPKTAELVSVFLDSSDFMGPDGFYGPGKGMATKTEYRWNYFLKIEKMCSYQIFGGADLELQAAQTSGVEISANRTQNYPNKAMELNANKTTYKTNQLVLGKSLSDSIGDNIKILRLRVGGNNHTTNILANEIALDILPADMGGEHSTPVCVFVNGSFWTYAFAEEGLGRNHISTILKMAADSVITAKLTAAWSTADVKKYGMDLKNIKDSLYSLCGFFNPCLLTYVCGGTVQFQIDQDRVNYRPAELDKFYHVVKYGSDSQLISSINREAFYRYALAVWFFQNEQAWTSFLFAVKPGKLPWILFSEHYDCELNDLSIRNDWDKYFTNYDLIGDDGSKKTLAWQAVKRLLACDKEYFCLVIEDELNTTYKPERTSGIAERKIRSFRPCITEGSGAWGHYDWPDSASWEIAVANIVPFFKERYKSVSAALPKAFMVGADTLLGLGNRNTVTIKFNKVPGPGVTVTLNSLLIDSDFTGLYYPSPQLQIALHYDHERYEFVKWLEYPNASAALKISASKSITLTPVIKIKQPQ